MTKRQDDWRTLSIHGETEPRVSENAEHAFAAEAEAKREDRRRAQLAELARRIEHAEWAVGAVREYAEQIAPVFARGTLRAIDDHFRRARGHLAGLADALRGD